MIHSCEDILSAKEIKKHLLNPDNYEIEVFDSIDSTNKTLKSKAKNGARPGTVLVANNQTAGKGRLGREFFSPANTGVYFSLLIHPEVNFELVKTSTAIAAVTLSKSLEKLLDIKTEIKWVNDIYLNGKKIAGILSEGVLDSVNNNIKYLIIGIGINVYQPNLNFPEEIQERADYLIKSYSIENLRNKIVASFLNNWEYYIEQKNVDEALQIFRERNFLQNKTVEVFVQGKLNKGQVLGINDQFELILENNKKEKMIINHGEATLHNKGNENSLDQNK